MTVTYQERMRPYRQNKDFCVTPQTWEPLVTITTIDTRYYAKHYPAS